MPRFRPQSLGRRLLAASRRGLRDVGHGWTPDLVVSYWLYPDAWAAQQLADSHRARHATIVGGSDVLQLPSDPLRGAYARDVLQRCDAALAVSEQLVRAIESVEPQAHAVVWSQGIRTETLFPGPADRARRELRLPPDGPVFLWVGRMVEVKRLDRLLDAFAMLKPNTGDAPHRLVLVGDGPSRAAAEAHAATIGVAHRVVFAGAIAPAELGPWYRACDAVVISSDSEGLPNVLREGLACGRPFASSDVGGISEIGDDGCRVLSDAGSAASLADAMATVLRPSFRDGAAAWPVRTWSDAAADLLAAVPSRPSREPVAI